MPEVITIRVEDPSAGRAPSGSPGQAAAAAPRQAPTATPMVGPTMTPMVGPMVPRTGMNAPVTGTGSGAAKGGELAQLNQLVSMFGTPDMKARFGQADQLIKLLGPESRPARATVEPVGAPAVQPVTPAIPAMQATSTPIQPAPAPPLTPLTAPPAQTASSAAPVQPVTAPPAQAAPAVQVQSVTSPALTPAVGPSAQPLAGPGALAGAGASGSAAGAGSAGAAGSGAAAAGVGGLAAAAGPIAAIAVAAENIKAGLSKAAEKPNDATNVASGLIEAGGGMLGKMVGKALDKVTQFAGDVIRSVGTAAETGADVVGTAAAGENREAVMKSTEAFVKLTGNIPLVGHQLELIGGTSLKVVRAFTDVTDAFVQRGEQLEKWSATVAVARGQADIRGLLGEFREADELGPGIARMTDAQSRLSDDLREMLLPIKKFVVEKLANLLERLVDWAEKVKVEEWGTKIVVTLEALGEAISQALDGNFGAAIAILNGIDKRIADEIDRQRKKADQNEQMPLDAFIGMLDRINPMQAVGPNVAFDPRVVAPIAGIGRPDVFDPKALQ